MTEMILTLLSLGYTVTFEGDGLGGCFCLLRRVTTQELVNCVIADGPESALDAALTWEKSRQLGNGTADRPPFDQERFLATLDDAPESVRSQIARMGHVDLAPQERQDVKDRLARLQES